MADGAAARAVELEPVAAPAASRFTRIELRDFLLVSLQVGLLLGVALIYRIELERGFAAVAGLTFAGFLVHAWLPARFRLPFFLLLSVTALALLLRADALWLVGLGLGLLGLCHLPIAWGARAALVAGAAGLLTALQAGWLTAPWGRSVLPVLASMFMFRLILYLYDLKKERTPAGPWHRLAFFFLLPNMCFPLFPLVDYRTFLRTYYARPAAKVYQKGAAWMLRGLVQLLAYRLIYQLVPWAENQHGIMGIYLFMAATYGLYLRVSGLFHLATGILGLFGFDLPPTHNRYFLAASFTDLWRRANIYWKDFMSTVVFYPVLMTARRWPLGARMLLATVCVVLVTWFLHAYQWFWLRGFFLWTATDLWFWSLLGVGLVANTAWETWRGRRRPKPAAWSWRAAAALSARTIGFFSLMAALWSMWHSGSLVEWGYRLWRVRESSLTDLACFGAILAAVFLAGIAAQRLRSARLEQIGSRHAPLLVPAAALVLLVLGLAQTVPTLQSTALNSIDRERQEQGYYESLSRATQLGMPEDDPEARNFVGSTFARRVKDLRVWVIAPGSAGKFAGVPFHANRWGMRDRDYQLAKPRGTYRIAVIGGSYEMGAGVADDEVFDNLVEDRLNRELAGRGYQRYEILNFAVLGFSQMSILEVVEHQVARFQPDAVLCFIHPREPEVNRLISRLYKHLVGPGARASEYAFLWDILQSAQAHGGLPQMELAHRLRPYLEQLFRWIWERDVTAIRAYRATPVFALQPLTAHGFSSEEMDELLQLARASGAVALSLDGAFDGHEPDTIQVSAYDGHPNALGHRLMADGLYRELLAHAAALHLLAPAR